MWIVVDIGCLECGADSDIVGVFTDEARAKAIVKTLNNRPWYGEQHAFEMFPMPEIDKINTEYVKEVPNA